VLGVAAALGAVVLAVLAIAGVAARGPTATSARDRGGANRAFVVQVVCTVAADRGMTGPRPAPACVVYRAARVAGGRRSTGAQARVNARALL
jgi:hypothetical protein